MHAEARIGLPMVAGTTLWVLHELPLDAAGAKREGAAVAGESTSGTSEEPPQAAKCDYRAA
jgi:hypothetical protein